MAGVLHSPSLTRMAALGSLLTFWGPNGLLFGSVLGSKTVFRSTHVVEQPFTMIPSILILDFDLIFGSFFTFWALMGLFWGWSRV